MSLYYSTPPNIAWQTWLENKFPPPKQAETKADGKDSGKKAQVSEVKQQGTNWNLWIKFILDQTIGALFNTVLFLVATGFLKGKDFAAIQEDLQKVHLEGRQPNVWPGTDH